MKKESKRYFIFISHEFAKDFLMIEVSKDEFSYQYADMELNPEFELDIDTYESPIFKKEIRRFNKVNSSTAYGFVTMQIK